MPAAEAAPGLVRNRFSQEEKRVAAEVAVVPIGAKAGAKKMVVKPKKV